VSTGQALVITAVSVVGALACAWQAIRAWRAADRHDVGPDSLRLLEDLDAHLDEHVAADPELAAGFDRLRTAIHEHREEDKT
jgi:cytochrome c-type biogenesis protein CcmH/NrfG